MMNEIKFRKLNFSHLTKEQLLNLSMHIGQIKKKWNKVMTVLIIGIRHSVLLLNLDYFFYNFAKILLFCSFIFCYYGKVVSYSNVTNLSTGGMSGFLLKRSNNLFYDGPYIGGILSNIYGLRQRLRKTVKLNQPIHHNLYKLRLKIPDFALIFNTHYFYYLVNEAACLGIPALSVVDSELDFLDSTYFLIGNPLSVFFSVYVILLMSVMKKNIVRLNYLYYYRVRLYLFFFVLKLKIYLILFYKMKESINNVVKNKKFNLKKVKFLLYFLFVRRYIVDAFFKDNCESIIYLMKLVYFKVYLFFLKKMQFFFFESYTSLNKVVVKKIISLSPKILELPKYLFSIVNVIVFFKKKMNFFLYFLKKLVIKKKKGIFVFFFFF